METTSNNLSSSEMTRIYGALRSCLLDNLSASQIRNICAAAGLDVTGIKVDAYKAEILASCDVSFRDLTDRQQLTAITIIADKLIMSNKSLQEDIENILGKHGFQFIDGKFIPISLLDYRESVFLPPNSFGELSKAMTRLIEGDESGAITSACGAIDSLTQQIYKNNGLGDPGRVAFQAKVNTSIQQLQVYEKMREQFIEQGIPDHDAEEILKHIKNAISNAANSLQVIRRTMGDVHGTKPALRQTAYDCIKWASSICAILKDQ